MKKIDWTRPIRYVTEYMQSEGTPKFVGVSHVYPDQFIYENPQGPLQRVDEFGRSVQTKNILIENTPTESQAYRVLYLNGVTKEYSTRAPNYSVTTTSVAELKRTLETLQRNYSNVRIFGVLKSNFVDTQIESLEFIPKESLEEFLKSNT